jgi:hypothetical protein
MGELEESSAKYACPYCGREFDDAVIPTHYIPEFADQWGNWECFGSGYHLVRQRERNKGAVGHE